MSRDLNLRRAKKNRERKRIALLTYAVFAVGYPSYGRAFGAPT